MTEATTTQSGTIVVAFGGGDAPELSGKLEGFAHTLEEATELAQVAKGSEADISASPWRIAVATSSVEALKEQLARSIKVLDKEGKGARLLAGRGIHLTGPTAERGKLGMLFPGQGSQYVGMLEDLLCFDEVSQTLAEADAVMEPVLKRPLTDILFGRGFESKDAATEMLKQTAVTQPAMLACDVAMLRLLRRFGVTPEVVAGHSLGEYAACVAAEVMTFDDALRVVNVRAQAMTEATPEGADPGWMAAIQAPVEEVEKVLPDVDGYVVAANKNCSVQTIIAGASKAVEAAMGKFESLDIGCMRLPVSHAFHTKVVASASEPLREALQKTHLNAPKIPVLANVTGDLYPTGAGCQEAIAGLLADQVASPVEFIAEVKKMHELGVRTFVEAGPKTALSSFVPHILGKNTAKAIVTNHPKKGGVRSLFEALAALLSAGFSLRTESL